MQPDCPLPQFEFDRITLGHGSGGLLTHRLLDSGVFAVLNNDWLAEAHDGAVLALNGPTAFSTDSYVISPLVFPGGNIGDLAINGTVNDLAMCGAAARYLSLSFILEEGLPMTVFAEVLQSIRNACSAAGVEVVTGDTKVVERGKGDGIFINTSGLGAVHARAAISWRQVRPGDVVIVSGAIAAHGMAILSLREGLEFETTLQSDTACLKHTVMALLDRFGPDLAFLRDPTRGGVATTLSELAKQTRLGIELEQTTLPIDAEVGGACELLGLDPLYVANEGIFLAVVRPESADPVLRALRADPNGRRAAVIGRITAEHPGQVVLRSSIGGRRVVGMLPGEQLPRIC